MTIEKVDLEEVLQELNTRDTSLDEEEDPIVGIKLSQLKNIIEQGLSSEGNIQYIKSLGSPKYALGEKLIDMFSGKSIKVSGIELGETNDPTKPWDWFYFSGWYGYPQEDLKRE